MVEDAKGRGAAKGKIGNRYRALRAVDVFNREWTRMNANPEGGAELDKRGLVF